MKLNWPALLVVIGLISGVNRVSAQNTAFTYQGRLNAAGAPANGSYDARFTLYNASSNGVAVAGPITLSAVTVSNGLFTTSVDFGNAFSGASNWLEIAVSTNAANDFTTLSPRQLITANPYAVHSITADSAASALTSATAASVAAANITGTITLTQLPSAVITNGATGVNVSGNFTGNGTGLTNLAASYLSTTASGPFAYDVTNLLKLQVTNIAFATNAVISTGVSYPLGITTADINGDGFRDVIFANFQTTTLSIWTNNGSGGFGSFSTLTVGSGPSSVLAVDVNFDGKMDLVSANRNANSLTILTNDGTGAFTVAQTIGTGGSGPRSLVGVDVNGDGKVDLVAANGGGSSVAILTNNGAGRFVLSSSPTTDAGPVSVITADVNGDGKPDLVTANNGTGSGNTLTVLTNNGSGGFATSSSPTIGSGANAVVAMDVNNDGKIDLVGNGYYSSSLTIVTNDGTGVFTLASTTGLFAISSEAMIAADLGLDGKLEIILASWASSALTIVTNNGSGTFGVASSIRVGTGPHCVAAGDLNNDGRIDLVAGAYPTNLVTVLTNSGSYSVMLSGNGGVLTNLSAGNLASGTVSDARLSTNVVLQNSTNVFLGSNRFANVLIATNTNNQLVGSFAGDGGGLTNLNASSLASGIIPLARIPSAVVTNGSSNLNLNGAFTGTFNGDGAGLTNLNVVQTLNGLNGNVTLTAGPNISLGISGNNLQINNTAVPPLSFLPTQSKTIYTNAGTYTVTIPASVTNLTVKLWGAGGGSGLNTSGGGGGYAMASMPVVQGDQFTVVVGERGMEASSTRGGSGSNDGEGGDPGFLTDYNQRGEGGQASSLFKVSGGSYVMKAVAGGGGGAGLGTGGNGGAGGGGKGGVNGDAIAGFGGTNGIGGAAGGGATAGNNYSTNALTLGETTLNLMGGKGGNGQNWSGGGGGGYGGGGGGGGGSAGSGAGGGGGGSYGSSTIAGNTNGFPGNTADSEYVSPAGSVNNNGLAVIMLNGATLTNDLFPANLSGSFDGNGAGLTNLNSSRMTGTIDDARFSTNVALLNSNSTFTGVVTIANANSQFSGNGSGLTGLNASNILSGTLADARLSTNVALLNGTNVFTGTNRFAGVALGSFTGNGGGLTNLNASNLVSGTVPIAQLPSAVVINGASGVTLTGSFNGNGTGLTNLSTSNLSSGTLADARLSSNVALLNGTNVFTGTISGNGSGLTNLTTPTIANYFHSYSTVTQAVAVVSVFQDITNQVDAQINGWTHTAGTVSFTNNQTGLYLVQYTATVTTTASAASTISLRAILNGNEIADSQSTTVVNTALQTTPISKSFIVGFTAGDVLRFQQTGSSTTDRIVSDFGVGTTRPSFSCTVIRIQ